MKLEESPFLKKIREDYNERIKESEEFKKPKGHGALSRSLENFLKDASMDSSMGILIEIRDNSRKILEKLNKRTTVPVGEAVVYINMSPSRIRPGTQEDVSRETIMDILLDVDKIKIVNVTEEVDNDDFEYKSEDNRDLEDLNDSPDESY